MKAVLAAVMIAVSAAAHAVGSIAYTDPKGNVLVLHADGKCAVDGAHAQMMKHGIPPTVAAMAAPAEILTEGKSIPACWVAGPTGLYVYAVAPSLGGGIIQLPLEIFNPHDKI